MSIDTLTEWTGADTLAEWIVNDLGFMRPGSPQVELTDSAKRAQFQLALAPAVCSGALSYADYAALHTKMAKTFEALRNPSGDLFEATRTAYLLREKYGVDPLQTTWLPAEPSLAFYAEIQRLGGCASDPIVPPSSSTGSGGLYYGTGGAAPRTGTPSVGVNLPTIGILGALAFGLWMVLK